MKGLRAGDGHVERHAGVGGVFIDTAGCTIRFRQSCGSRDTLHSPTMTLNIDATAMESFRTQNYLGSRISCSVSNIDIDEMEFRP